MKIVIVGGDKVTYHLVKALADSEHDIIVVENRLAACERLNSDLNVTVFHGDGTDLAVLRMAHAREADVFIALTGKDENNLIACMLAKESLKAKTTVAKVNNSKNRDIFTLKGIDKSFSSTQILVDLIEQEVEFKGMRTAFSVPGNPMEIVEFILSPLSDACGQSLQAYNFPGESKLVLLTHANGQVELPRGDLQMQAGDVILLICHQKDKERVWRRFVHPEELVG